MSPAGDPLYATAKIDAALSETLRGHTSFWWDMRLSRWGGLSARELADLGCFLTVAHAVKDLIDHRNVDLQEANALWFDPDHL